MSDKRLQQLSQWTNIELARLQISLGDFQALEVVSGDASFRRYFRARLEGKNIIAVDAPPASEDSEQFVKLAGLFRGAAVSTPEVIAVNLDKGFMLLEDFGDALYLPELLRCQQSGSEQEADVLYQQAIAALVKFQKSIDGESLGCYDRKKLHKEMALFESWFCGQLLELELTDAEQELIASTLSFLEESALSQTRYVVHRDYHSRNLLILDKSVFSQGAGPGIIDFQDALNGPYTYDLVSLLRDCYIRWPAQQLEKWRNDYFRQASEAGLLEGITAAQFVRDFDLMGLQRHLKVIGIFSRLCIRDNKPQYLADIPLVIRYFLEVAAHYEELAVFSSWFERRVLPVAEKKLN